MMPTTKYYTQIATMFASAETFQVAVEVKKIE